ncbi:MAG TPA: CBS domain-containing protein [Solirubrobacteraceae bacterium]
MSDATRPVSESSENAVLVREIMRPGVLTCRPSATAAEVARLMGNAHVHCVAVLASDDEEGRPPHIRGVVTDLDLLAAVPEPDRYPDAHRLARRPAVVLHPTMTVEQAATLMRAYHADHAVVVDAPGRVPAGIVSAHDIAQCIARGDRRPPVRPARDQAHRRRVMLRDRASRNP